MYRPGPIAAAFLGLAISACASSDAGSPDGGGASGDAGGTPGADAPCCSEAAVYVNGNGGNDNNLGTAAAPLATIAAGIDKAAALSPPGAVWVATGIYEEEIEVASGVSILGGFEPAGGWERDPLRFPTEIRGIDRTVIIDGTTAPVLLDGLTITSADATAPGTSSTAVWINGASKVDLVNVIVTPGNGAPGADGGQGSTGGQGYMGGRGEKGCEESGGLCSGCDRPAGGAGGLSDCGRTGGVGGRPGRSDNGGEAGGTGTGGTPGGAGAPAKRQDGSPGDPGADGQLGSHGAGGADLGMFDEAGNYVASNAGEPGGAGTDGNGGGGGGGGGGGTDNCDSYGSAGGGGGGGGCGGTGGEPGSGGGGSFGVIVVDSAVTFRESQIEAGFGGDGGAGGPGGGGGPGGSPGLGGPYGGSGEQDDGGDGAPGGRGGAGGQGGAGGGGGGGPSAAIVCLGSSNVTIPSTQLSNAGRSSGGASDGTPGADGIATPAYACSLF